MKHLGVNRTNSVWDLYAANYKIMMKENTKGVQYLYQKTIKLRKKQKISEEIKRYSSVFMDQKSRYCLISSLHPDLFGPRNPDHDPSKLLGE